MPPFIPIRAISRSQAIRIGGQTIKTNVTSYVDLGNLAPLLAAPTVTVSTKEGKKAELHAGSNAKALIKSKFFGYAVTAVDATGVETPISGTADIETEAGAEGEGSLNFIKVEWKAVPSATSYNVYRVGKSQTGIATAALALSGTLGFLANVLPATNTTIEEYIDTGVEVTSAKPATVNNTNIYPKRAFSPIKELRNHLAIGAVVVAGPLTASNSDWVVVDTPSTMQFVLTFGAEEAKVATGEIKNRATGQVVFVEKATVATVEAIAGKEIRSYLVFNTQTRLVEVVEGVAAATAKAVLPAFTSVQVPLYSIYAKASKTPALLYDLRPRQ